MIVPGFIRAPALDDADQDDRQRDHQQDVDEPTQRVRRHHSEQPEHQQDHEDRPEHTGLPRGVEIHGGPSDCISYRERADLTAVTTLTRRTGCGWGRRG